MHISIYWLGKDIYNYHKDFHHLKRNNIIKTYKIPPFYYRDLIYYIKTKNPSIPTLQNKTKIICKIILEKGSQITTYSGKENGKIKYQTLILTKYGHIPISHIANHTPKTYYINSYTMPSKQTILYLA